MTGFSERCNENIFDRKLDCFRIIQQSLVTNFQFQNV